jgi:NAD-dependent deacetylase
MRATMPWPKWQGAYRQFRLITQNVDGFHQQAGSEDVLELHGNIRRSICSVTRRPIDPSWLAKHAESSPPPSPHHPDGLARPDVVWFGEALDAETLDQAFAAAATAN